MCTFQGEKVEAMSDIDLSDSQALIHRLNNLEARNEITDLEGRYARTWDSGDGPGWADVFTDDGVWVAVRAGTQSPHREARGRAELEAMCIQYATFLTGLHFLHISELEIAGDRARSLVYLDYRGVARPPGEDEVIHKTVSGYYLVQYLRTERGWLMAHREEHLVAFSSTTYVGGMLSLDR